MTRIARAEGMSIYDYVCFLSDTANELKRRSRDEKEDTKTLGRERDEIAEELRKIEILIAEKREPIFQAPKPVAAPVVPTVEAAVEEPEIESKEEDEELEEEVEEHSDEESEEEDGDYAKVQQYLTRMEYDIIFGEDDDISEENRIKFMYAIRRKNPFIDSLITQWEQHMGIVEIIDPYNEVPKTEVVRDGDIITVRYVDGPPANKQILRVEEPKEVAVDDVSKEVTLDATSETTNTTIPEDSSPIINGDVAHHPEPFIELSLDNARDELSIESIEEVDEELSEENQVETDSLSIDRIAVVDRHREENQNSLDFYTPIIENSRAQSDTAVDFVFSQEAFHDNPDPLMANEEPAEAWNPINFLFGIIGFIKNGAKMLASKIDRRRTKGALALPFDSYD